MDINVFRLIHIIGIATLFVGLGGMFCADAQGGQRRTFAMWQGIGLLLMIISGFGMLGIMKLGFPKPAIAKVILWAGLAVLPVLTRRKVVPTGVAVLLAIILGGVLAWIGLNFAALLPVTHSA